MGTLPYGHHTFQVSEELLELQQSRYWCLFTSMCAQCYVTLLRSAVLCLHCIALHCPVRCSRLCNHRLCLPYTLCC
jgi:hypothetical protein